MISAMQNQFLHLPIDVLFLVLDQLDASSLASLCRTCQCLHNITTTCLYSRLIVKDSTRAASLARCAALRHGDLVRTLRVNIDFQGCVDVACDLCLHQATSKSRDDVCWAVEYPGGGLPPAVKELLEGRQGLLPRLERIEIFFPEKNNHMAMDPPGHGRHELDHRLSLLRRENMRIVTRAAMKALARNKTITKLTLANCPPFWPFGSDQTDRCAWEGMLGRLTEFDLSLCGMIDSFDYREFVWGVQGFFLKNLKSVRRLRIRAAMNGPSKNLHSLSGGVISQ